MSNTPYGVSKSVLYTLLYQLHCFPGLQSCPNGVGCGAWRYVSCPGMMHLAPVRLRPWKRKCAICRPSSPSSSAGAGAEGDTKKSKSGKSSKKHKKHKKNKKHKIPKGFAPVAEGSRVYFNAANKWFFNQQTKQYYKNDQGPFFVFDATQKKLVPA